jgi:hypothetical protein
MKRTVRFGFFGLVIAAGLTTAALALDNADGSPAQLRFSPAGTPVDVATLPAGERTTLEQAGIAPSVNFVREATGVRFYTGTSREGSTTCLITGIAFSARPHFGVLVCPSPDFPSAELPIYDYSPRRAALMDPYPHIQYLAGFAADGITGVGVRDEHGDVRWTDVVQNTYASRDVPAGGATAILARGKSGDVVYSQSLGGGTTESQYAGSP